MDVDDSDGSERRAMTPEEVLDELRDEVRRRGPARTPRPSFPTPLASRGQVDDWDAYSLFSLPRSLTDSTQVKDELEAARRESAIAEAEVCDLRQEIDRIQVRMSRMHDSRVPLSKTVV